MPNYPAGFAVPRLDLGVAMWDYLIGSQTFIGTKVLPIFKSAVKSANFSRITRDSILRSRNVKRAPRSAYSRDTYDAKDQLFNCQERGHEQPLDDGERRLYQNSFNAEMAASKIAGQIVLQEQEKDISGSLFNTATFTGATFNDVSANPWATAATDIIGQVDAAKDAVRQNSGMTANALVISKSNVKNLKKNTNIKAAVQYVARTTEAEILNAVADLFGLKYILIGDMIKNTANEGQAFAGADIWSSTYALVARIAETDDLTEPCLGRTFLWETDSPDAATVEEYREEQTRSWVYRVRHHADEVVFDTNYAQLLKIA
jgi:hypothetical protein